MKLVAAQLLAASIACTAAFAQGTPAAQQDRIVRINQIQVIGSHNSYHAGFAPSERAYLEKVSPRTLSALDYSHAPLADQLTGGGRP